jgi:organic radical activating enzyme
MIVKIENNQQPNVLRIEYMLGNTCNQKCNYCFPGSNEGDHPWPDFETVKKNLSHLLDYYKKNGKEVFNIFFVGGEPTLWDGFLPLCEYLKSKYKCILEISTNGTRGVIWWTKAGRVLDHVNISVHHEYAKIQKIKTLADFLYELGVFVNVDVLMDPAAFEKCVKLVEDLSDSKCAWPVLAKVVHYNGESRYTSEQQKYFIEPIKRYPSKEWFAATVKKPRTEVYITNNSNTVVTTTSDSYLTLNKLNYFKDWNCNLGVDLLKIFYDGRITGNCQQKLFGSDTYHNLYEPNFDKTFQPEILPVVCTKSICGCNGEIILKKWISNDNL